MRQYYMHMVALADSDLEALTMAGEIAGAAGHPVIVCLESVDVEVGIDGSLVAVDEEQEEDGDCCGCCGDDMDCELDAILDNDYEDDDDSDIIDE
jgi:hypothetical protein